MVNKIGLVVVGALLLGLTAFLTLGVSGYPNGANYAPQNSVVSQAPRQAGCGGVGYGRGMMGGYGSYSGQPGEPNPYQGEGFNGMWAWCRGVMNSWLGGQPQGVNEVAISRFGFVPQVITVKVGSSVTWRNYDSVQHSITSGTAANPTSLFDSGEMVKGQVFSYSFTQAGTFTYFCDEHPEMTGVVIVET